MKHPFTTFLAVLLLTMLVTIPANAAPEPQTKPNIIIILADDLGPGDMSCAGATKIKTPHIDHLASRGVRFTNGYLNNISYEPTGIERPDLLKQGADKQHSCTIINGISRIGYMKGGQAARFKDEELASTVVAKSIEYLERNQNKPFFLSVGLFEPHVPRVAEPPFVGKSGCGVRGDVIMQADWQVGEIMKTLDRLNLTKNTMVIFSSDNGPVLFDGYHDRSVEDLNGHAPTDGLRGWKYLTYEGGCRVPFIVRWPDQIKPRVSEQMISLVDCYATLAKIVGADFPKRIAPDSMDLSDVVLGKSEQNIRTHTVLHGVGGLALRDGDWKYIPATTLTGGIGSGANAADERFAAANIPEPLLFNLASDPNEKTNVHSQFPEKAKELSEKLGVCETHVIK